MTNVSSLINSVAAHSLRVKRGLESSATLIPRLAWEDLVLEAPKNNAEKQMQSIFQTGEMDYHACSKQVEKKYADSEDIEMLIATYKASIPFANDQNSPLGRLSDIAISLEYLDTFSANLLSQTKSRIQSEHLSWLITVRKQIAVMYCLIANLFSSDKAVSDKVVNEAIITYYFVNYDLRQAFIIINGYVEILVHKAREQKPKTSEIFQSIGNSKPDELAERMSKAAPENQMNTSFHSSDLKMLLEIKQKCNEINQSIETIRSLFVDFEETVRLY